MDQDHTTPADAAINRPTEPKQDTDGSSWILHGINQLNEKIDRLDDRLDSRIEKLDDRLHVVEKRINRAIGWAMAMAALLAILQVVLRFLGSVDISVTPTQ